MSKTFAILFALIIEAAAITAPVLSTAAGTDIYDMQTYGGSSSENTPPTITFLIKNGTTFYNSANLTIGFYTNQSDPPLRLVFDLAIYSVSYQASWEDKPKEVYSYSVHNVSDLHDDDPNHQVSFSYNLTNIPEGHHQLKVKVTGGGYRALWSQVAHVFMDFSGSSSSLLDFTVLVPPVISNLSIKNQKYNSTSIPLAFNINKEHSWIGYSLDGVANETVGGNATLTGLKAGNHSVIVYANDTFGATTKSESTNFTIKEPETSLALAVVTLVVIAIIISLGLLVYFKKRRKQS